MSKAGEYGNPLQKFKLVFLGEQSGSRPTICDVTKHRTVAKYRSWVLVKCVWCGAYYWFRLRKGSGCGVSWHPTICDLFLLLISSEDVCSSGYASVTHRGNGVTGQGSRGMLCFVMFDDLSILERTIASCVHSLLMGDTHDTPCMQTSASWRLLTSGRGPVSRIWCDY